MESIPKIVSLLLHSADYIRIGSAMLEEIREGRLSATKQSREAFCEKSGCSVQQYYSVLKLLVESKLVVKEGKQYKLNRYWLVDVTKDWLEFARVE